MRATRTVRDGSETEEMSLDGAEGPFADFDRVAWARLGENVPLPLTADELARLRSVGDEVDLTEVREVYLPLSRLLTLHVQESGRLYRAYRTFLGAHDARTPFVIGVAGSVSVGKSTTARLLALLLARWPQHPRVELVTTDGFLWPNAELERRGLMERKGFPESYDRRALLRFVTEVKAGKPRVVAPVYSHLTYDIVAGEQTVTHRPDILLLEGLNVLQPAPGGGGAGGERLHRLLRVRRRGGRRHPALVRGAVPAVAGDGVPEPELVLPPVRGDGRGGSGGAGGADLGGDQRAEPGVQHLPDAGAGDAGAAEGPGAPGDAGAAAEGVIAAGTMGR
jgi:pantothenate kinase